MPRARRYRVFVLFAVISTLAFFYFSGITAWWSSAPAIQQPITEKPLPGLNVDQPESKDDEDTTNPHGFAPELPIPTFRIEPPNASPDDSTVEDPSSVDLPEDEQPAVPVPTPTSKPKPQIVEDDGFVQNEQGRLEVPDLDQSAIRWKKLPEHFPIASTDIIPLPTGQPKPISKIQFDFPEETDEEKREREKILGIIKDAFLHAWNGYKTHAMGHDEVAPVSGKVRDPFMGWGATLVDSLDTLWIMGLKEEFEEAVEETKKLDFGTSKRKDIPLFETVIRYLGGLIGAYDISGQQYPALLDKAVELAEILMGAFDTPNRMPATFYNWAPVYASKPHRAGSRVVLAELGSLSVEFTRLAQLTKKHKYYDAVARITNELEAWQNNTRLPGLWPAHVDASGCKKLPSLEKRGKRDITLTKHNAPKKILEERDTPITDPLFEDAQPADYDGKLRPEDIPKPPTNPNGKAKTGSDQENGRTVELSDFDCEKTGLQSAARSTAPDRFTLGALADSTYEYLPKEYLLLGGLVDQYRTMYETAMDTTRKYLLYRPMLPDNRDVRFLASATPSESPDDEEDFEYKYEGSHLACFAGGMFGIGAKVFGLKDDLDIAKKLTEGCVWAYESTTTGIMPESFLLLPCYSMTECEWNQTRYYDVIDPFEAIRMSKLELWKEMKAKLEEEDSRIEEEDSSPTSETEVEDALRKRDVTGADSWPTKTKKGDLRNPVPGGLGPKPTVLSHEEYAEKRIREERIPLGMAEVTSSSYILRPEAIESVFIMYRITGDDSWRKKGWKMFRSIVENTRTELGHSAIKDVTSEVPYFSDVMESFWLGETLKYSYLLFSHPQVVSLDEYIFNTEAHPLKRPNSI
ncbi:hypothetical protein VTO42DRAFT_2784 [Malbranchea cinnamomea]